VKAALISFVLLPLLMLALTTRAVGFRLVYMLAASVVGEMLGLLLYATHKQVRVISILTGLASGSVMYTGGAGPRNPVKGVLEFAAFGMVIAVLVWTAHRIFIRVRRT
jgi:hypothetical protein